MLADIWPHYCDRRWADPFCGSGALPFILEPERCLLSDGNCYLIASYFWLAAGAKRRIFYEMEEDDFYNLRKSFNKNRGTADRLWLGEAFWLLNRSSHSGLWRVNQAGEMNAPWGYYKSLPQKLDMKLYASLLQQPGWEIRHLNFSESLGLVKPDDFLFLDPPYHNTFDDYVSGGFDWKQQLSLAHQAADHPGPVILCNSCSWPIARLYESHGFSVFYLPSNQHFRQGKRDGILEIVATKNIPENIWQSEPCRAVPDSLSAIPEQLSLSLG